MARKLILFLAALSLVSVFTGCPNARHSAQSSTLRLSQRNEPSDLDPATATLPDEYFIIRALSEGLVTPSPTGSGVVSAAATRWHISADGLTYTFYLKPGALWSNGEAVTAADFIASYERALTPATLSPKAPLFYAVKNARAYVEGKLPDFSYVGFSAPDALTLVITLEHPSPSFLSYVASGPWIPVNPRVVAKYGRTWTQPAHFVGNGAFILTEWQTHQRIVVKKNPHYRPAPRVNEIQFIRMDSADTEERTYRAGQLDVTMDVPKTKIGIYRQERAAELHREALAETRYLSLNTSREPLNDPRVRLALSLSLDRRLLVEKVLLGGQDPAFRFVPPSLFPEGPTSALFAEDTERARALLSEAGYPGGKGFPRLEFSSWSNSPIIEAVQAMWKKELGIEVALANREARVHLASLRTGTYDIAFITSIPDVADAFDVLSEFTSTGASNYPHWADTEFDQLLAAASREPSSVLRSQILLDAEARLVASGAAVPLYFNAKNWLMRTRVKNWQEDALWTRFYNDVFLDEN